MLQLPALGENQEKAAWKYLGNNQRKCDACTCWTHPQNRQGGLHGVGAAAQWHVWHNQHGAECCVLRAACLFFVQ